MFASDSVGVFHHHDMGGICFVFDNLHSLDGSVLRVGRFDACRKSATCGLSASVSYCYDFSPIWTFPFGLFHVPDVVS